MFAPGVRRFPQRQSRPSHKALDARSVSTDNQYIHSCEYIFILNERNGLSLSVPSMETRGLSATSGPGRVRTAVLGARGYAGQELMRLLSRHGRVEAPVALSRPEDTAAADIPSGKLLAFSWDALAALDIELLFLATPHELSLQLVPQALQRGIRVVDLSGGWRLKQAAHRAVYGFDEADQSAVQCAAGAAYGLPELHRAEIEQAGLVANPGCYATSVILALAPLLRAGLVDVERGIISDSKSGVSGAGKALSERTSFMAVADNLSAYALFTHRHVGEMAEQLGIAASSLTFTPHLLPIPRGILSTIYVQVKSGVSALDVEQCFHEAYANEAWVRVYETGKLPEIRFSVNTNYCDIGFHLAADGHRLIVVSCLDNLMKGAAGQAVQNMNVMYGWDEKEGLL